MSFDRLLNSVCDIEQKTETQSATSGQKVITYTNRYHNVACRIEPLSGDEFWGQNQALAKASHIIYLKYGFTVLVTDRVKIGTTYYNILVTKNAAGQNHHLELIVEIVE